MSAVSCICLWIRKYVYKCIDICVYVELLILLQAAREDNCWTGRRLRRNFVLLLFTLFKFSFSSFVGRGNEFNQIEFISLATEIVPGNGISE